MLQAIDLTKQYEDFSKSAEFKGEYVNIESPSAKEYNGDKSDFA